MYHKYHKYICIISIIRIICTIYFSAILLFPVIFWFCIDHFHIKFQVEVEKHLMEADKHSTKADLSEMVNSLIGKF